MGAKERHGQSHSAINNASSPSVDTDDGAKKRRKKGSLQWLVLASVVFVVFVTMIRLHNNHQDNVSVRSSSSSITNTPQQQASSVVSNKIDNNIVATVTVPDCPKSPWKEEENLVGTCPGGSGMKRYEVATTLHACATSCCDRDDCITWQFRDDTGCLQGGDIRIGMEKDGTPHWCSDTVPYRWQGQYVKDRTLDCNTATWSPHQKEGQCFGLGDKKQDASASAEACMMACCMKETCGAWQWNSQAGCFYGKGMHGCQDTANNPKIFEPFTGRRKRLATRKYVDQRGRPWKQQLSSA